MSLKVILEIIKTCNFGIDGKFYMVDQSSEDKIIKSIIANKSKLEVLAKEKVKQKVDFLDCIGHYKIISMLEYYLEHHDVQQLYVSKHKEICSICRFELYDEEGNEITYDGIIGNLTNNDDGDVIKMDKCEEHYFHSGCLQNYINSQESKDFLKCPNCCFIYGVMKGDQPDGNMDYHLDKNVHCDGYTEGTISIDYSFPSGKLANGKRYKGTSRWACLPHTQEGLEVLKLLIVSFERRLTFTVGTSVTTGQKDCVVWNGVHHKTNLSGGSSRFGFPDPTYFNRVKLELASKGVYPEGHSKFEN